MPRGPRSIRNPQYSSGSGGGGGGGLGSVIGALLGVPVIEGGEDLAGLAGAENNVGGEPVIGPGEKTPLTVKKPGFFQNLVTRGQAGQQAAGLQNQIQLEQYNSGVKQDLLNKHLAGQQGLETLRTQNDLKQAEVGHGYDLDKLEREYKLRRELEELQTGLKDGFPDFQSWVTNKVPLNTVKNGLDLKAYQDPGIQEAYQGNILAGLNKAGIGNEFDKAKTIQALSEAKRNGRFILNEKDALVSPDENLRTINSAPGQYPNFPSGGPVDLTNPGEFDVSKDGSLVRPVRKVGNSVSAQTGNPITAITQPPKPLPVSQFTQAGPPGFGELMKSSGEYLGNALAPMAMGGFPNFTNPTNSSAEVNGRPDSFEDFQNAPPLMQQGQYPYDGSYSQPSIFDRLKLKAKLMGVPGF